LVPRRQLTRFSVAIAACLVATALAAPVAADASNRRIAIGDYRWTPPEVDIDLGEHVTWHWVGPDTVHSVTGTSANAIGLDSDPQTAFPNHPVGDSFRLDFDAPGSYQFHCKLHSFVRGTVVVSSTPGNPNTEVDPVPPIQVDLQPPTVSELRLNRYSFRPRGTAMPFALDERSTLDAEIYRLRKKHKPRYAGYREWNAYIGYNSVKFGGRSDHFKARPGRYRAVIIATDESANTVTAKRLRFSILKT
jgi:plastocyanin